MPTLWSPDVDSSSGAGQNGLFLTATWIDEKKAGYLTPVGISPITLLSTKYHCSNSWLLFQVRLLVKSQSRWKSATACVRKYAGCYWWLSNQLVWLCWEIKRAITGNNRSEKYVSEIAIVWSLECYLSNRKPLFWGGGFCISRQNAERICAKDSTDVHSCQ